MPRFTLTAGLADAGSQPDYGADRAEREDAEWREVARAEMLEERYRGMAKVAPLEHCLSVGSHERVRLQVLLETRGGREEELDVQVCPQNHTCNYALHL
jgi:hypothetical protein